MAVVVVVSIWKILMAWGQMTVVRISEDTHNASPKRKLYPKKLIQVPRNSAAVLDHGLCYQCPCKADTVGGCESRYIKHKLAKFISYSAHMDCKKISRFRLHLPPQQLSLLATRICSASAVNSCWGWNLLRSCPQNMFCVLCLFLLQWLHLSTKPAHCQANLESPPFWS